MPGRHGRSRTFFSRRKRICVSSTRCLAAGITVPIVPGIMPVFANFAQAGKIRRDERVQRARSGWGGCSRAPRTTWRSGAWWAMIIAAEQVRLLQANGIDEFHFYTLNRPDLDVCDCPYPGGAAPPPDVDHGLPPATVGPNAARPYTPVMTDYLARLNAEQRQAVEALDGPLLVLAGAGTGKTRVLTTRFAHILLTGRAYPNQVLAVTFTNKAAREMRERVGAILGHPPKASGSAPSMRSAPACCAAMPNRWGCSNFRILDADDQLRLLKQVMEALRMDTKRWAPPAMMALIQRWKNRGLTPARVGS